MHRSERTLCIIPCGSKKIWENHPEWGSVEADRAYISPFHRLCKNYAKTFFSRWLILSAKYGLLDPDDLVGGPYDVTFNRASDEIISMRTLKEQAIQKQLSRFHDIVVLAGKKYRKPVTETFPDHSIRFPFEHYKGIGYIQQALKRAVSDQQPIH